MAEIKIKKSYLWTTAELDILKKYLSKYGLKDQYEHNFFAFKWACRNGEVDIAELLMRDKNVDIYAENEYALRKAVEYGKTLMVNALCGGVINDFKELLE